MKRFDGSENFNREWEDYKRGFGNLSGEFWAGILQSRLILIVILFIMV